MALKVLVEEGMIANAAEQGAYFMSGLGQIRSNAVKEIRGRGLMLAVELHPEAGGARRYCDALKEQGILCKDTHQHSIRIAPPLVIKRDEVDWALERFSNVLTKLA
jgi:ornithine--oxo-acid transaminase